MARKAFDPFKGHIDHPNYQARKIRQIVPDDANELLSVPKAIRIKTDGNLCFEPAGGYEADDGTVQVGPGAARILAVTAGTIIDWIQIKQVYQTGTTCTCEALV